MTFPQGYNTTSLANALLDVRRTKKAFFGLGRMRMPSPSDSPVSVYSRERTLGDILRGSEVDDTGRAGVAFGLGGQFSWSCRTSYRPGNEGGSLTTAWSKELHIRPLTG
jgi:hypothetical protein